MVQAAAGALLVILVCTAAYWDATTGRIPNELAVAGLVSVLLLRAPLGLDRLLEGVVGFGLAFGIAIVLYALRAIGGGDVKLVASVGAFFGTSDVIGALGLIAVLGSVRCLW